MKPTWGLVSWTGMATHEPIHDTTGPMSLDVATNAKILQAIAGRDEIDDRGCGVPSTSELPDYSAGLGLGVKGLKIGILKEGFDFAIMDPRIRQQVLEAAEKLKLLGAEVVEISIPIHTHAPDIVTCALRASAAQNRYLGRASGRRGLYLNGLVEKMTPMSQDKFDRVIPLYLLCIRLFLIPTDVLDKQVFPTLRHVHLGKSSSPLRKGDESLSALTRLLR